MTARDADDVLFGVQDGTEWDSELRMWVWKSEHGDAYLDPSHGSVMFRVLNSKFRFDADLFLFPPCGSGVSCAPGHGFVCPRSLPECMLLPCSASTTASFLFGAWTRKLSPRYFPSCVPLHGDWSSQIL